MPKAKPTSKQNEPSNDANYDIVHSNPYRVELTIEGTTDLLFHRWSPEAVKEKANAAKASETKRTDNLESYVYRTDDYNIGLPGEYLRMSICNAAKFESDKRSTRKSCFDLFKAGLLCNTFVADLGSNDWEYEDTRRVTIQRQGINRVRPAFKKGWQATFELEVVLPEYIPTALLKKVIDNAGRVIGVGDFRPTFGRFSIVSYRVLEAA
jgi:hypothetical protein